MWPYTIHTCNSYCDLMLVYVCCWHFLQLLLLCLKVCCLGPTNAPPIIFSCKGFYIKQKSMHQIQSPRTSRFGWLVYNHTTISICHMFQENQMKNAFHCAHYLYVLLFLCISRLTTAWLGLHSTLTKGQLFITVSSLCVLQSNTQHCYE